MTRRRVVALAAAAAILLGGVALALARPGGGDSYSGGGGFSSGGGGGGGDSDGGAILELLFHLIRLCFYAPEIGVPILAIVIGFLLWSAYRKHQNKDWDSGPAAPVHRAVALGDIRRVDPDFSQVLFEDFVFRLFGAAHRLRGTPGGLAEVAPYVAPPAQAALTEREPVGAPVHSVVVGALRVVDVVVPAATAEAPASGQVRVGIEFEANVTAGAPGAELTFFSVEQWLLTRDVGARTKPPGQGSVRSCPNCGAAWQASHTGTQKCAYCGEIVDNGRFAWQVAQITLASIDPRPPTLTASVPERGTDLPTFSQPGFVGAWHGLLQEDPAITSAAIAARLHHVYALLNAGWAQNDLTPARGVVSDALYDYLTYWTDAYRRQGLRNALERMRITRHELCKLVRDRWYDALTIRIWGTGLDYVVREPGGDVVRGSRHRERAYSEYWTLVRSSARRGPTRADPGCGNCGAPLTVTQSGACAHCGAHVTAGEFDWVLSKIEQDDSYRG